MSKGHRSLLEGAPSGQNKDNLSIKVVKLTLSFIEQGQECVLTGINELKFDKKQDYVYIVTT